MRESEFAYYLLTAERIKSREKALRSRVAKVRLVERYFNMSLDSIVADDEKTYKTLLRIKSELKTCTGLDNRFEKVLCFLERQTVPDFFIIRKSKGVR